MKKRVHIFYYNKTRNDGTAFYSWYALKKLAKEYEFDLHFYLPPDGKFANNEPLPKSDFNIWVDWGEDCFGGTEYVPPSPNAVWWVDTHLGKEYRIKRSLKFDKTYLAQLNDVENFKKAGVNDVWWLPLAAEPDVWKPLDIIKQYDVAFIGFLNCKKRIEHLETLFKEFPNFYYGVTFFDRANKKFNESRMLFNISIKDDINMRFFEAMSTGVPLLTNKIVNNGMEELAIPFDHFMSYKNEKELIDRTHQILKDPEIFNKMGKNASEHVRNHHTYYHRMKKVLTEGGVL